MFKHTAVYARVSSEQQAKEGTIDSQLDAVRSFIAAQGWSVTAEHEFIDNGVSGMQFERPALDRLRDQIALGRIARVVVLCRDRLSRNFIHQELLREEWEHAGCELLFVQEPPILTSADLVSSQMRGIFSQYERIALLERTRRGRLFRAQQGEPPPSAPWGYSYQPRVGQVPAYWEIEAEPADWVRQIYRWVWQDHFRVRDVARACQEKGIAPPHGGAYWRPATIHGLLTNPAYAGETFFQRSQRKHAGQGKGPWKQKRPPEDWIKIAVPAIVSHEEWEMVQEELARHSQLASRHAQARRYLLQGLLRCGHCGRRLAGRFDDGHIYYVCRSKRDLPLDARCPSPWLRGDTAESLLWQAIKELLLSPEQVFATYQEQRQLWLAGEGEQERLNLEKGAAAVQQRWQRMLSAFQHDAIDLEELKQARRHKDLAEEDLDHRRQVWQERQQQTQAFAAALARLESYHDTIRLGLENLTFEQQREILTLLVEEVVVYPDKLLIRHILPADPALGSPRQKGPGDEVRN